MDTTKHALNMKSSYQRFWFKN